MLHIFYYVYNMFLSLSIFHGYRTIFSNLSVALNVFIVIHRKIFLFLISKNYIFNHIYHNILYNYLYNS